MGDEEGMDTTPHPETGLNTAEVQPEEDNPSVEPRYSPLDDAYCFNEKYQPEALDLDGMVNMYRDFVKIFQWGFKNQMGSPLQSVSDDNNNVSNNRFPGMYLRMCFHDNTVVPSQPDFQDYVRSMIEEDGEWTGPGKYMKHRVPTPLC